MSKYFICCEQCFEDIGKRNTRAAKLWMDFCAMHMNYDQEIFSLNTLDFPELRVLETLGFLVSTDQERNLAVKVNGYCKSMDGDHFFCVKEGNHV